MLPCVAKTCAVRPCFARVVGALQRTDANTNVQGAIQHMLVQGSKSDAPRRSLEPRAP